MVYIIFIQLSKSMSMVTKYPQHCPEFSLIFIVHGTCLHCACISNNNNARIENDFNSRLLLFSISTMHLGQLRHQKQLYNYGIAVATCTDTLYTPLLPADHAVMMLYGRCFV